MSYTDDKGIFFPDDDYRPFKGRLYYAPAAERRGWPSSLDEITLRSEIIPGQLWQGGCFPYGIGLQGDFEFVMQLANDGYRLDSRTSSVVCYFPDSDDVPYRMVDNAVDDVIDALQKGKKTLVHCQVGVNRSGMVTALVLMQHYGYSAQDAINTLRAKRFPLVLCNEAFEEYVKECGDE